MRSGADTPILFNFLPLHHVVLLRADTIVPHLEDYAAALAAYALAVLLQHAAALRPYVILPPSTAETVTKQSSMREK